MGNAPYQIIKHPVDYQKRWYGAFSSSGPCRVIFNVGQLPFLYPRVQESCLQLRALTVSESNGSQAHSLMLLKNDSMTTLPLTSTNTSVQITQPFTSLIDSTPVSSLTTLNELLFLMIPNCLPSKADPFLRPTVEGHTIWFPPQTKLVTRSCLSNLPLKSFVSRYQYFEFRLLASSRPFNSFVSIGFVVPPYSPFHHIGCDFQSVGYHRFLLLI